MPATRHLDGNGSRVQGAKAPPLPAVHDELVRRDFTAEVPDTLWVGDITEHPTGEWKLCLCAFKDLWSTRIVGYSINDHMTTNLAVAAIHNAVVLRDTDGTVRHADGGSQFRCRAFTVTLDELDLNGSMGHVGAAGDNAVIESFFSLLQENVFNTRRWDIRD